MQGILIFFDLDETCFRDKKSFSLQTSNNMEILIRYYESSLWRTYCPFIRLHAVFVFLHKCNSIYKFLNRFKNRCRNMCHGRIKCFKALFLDSLSIFSPHYVTLIVCIKWNRILIRYHTKNIYNDVLLFLKSLTCGQD